MSDITCCSSCGSYCDRCDLLVGLGNFHVIDVRQQADLQDLRLRILIESSAKPEACRQCGVIALSHGRRNVRLVDTPCFGRPVRLVWRKRIWRCVEAACDGGAFTEQEERLARPRALLTQRACWWSIGQLRAEHASVAGLARQLGTSWRTLWASIKPLL